MKLSKEEVRRYMELAVDVMHKSKQERRDDDQVSPKVGAVLYKAGKVTVAHRGEFREGDHAEFSLLEKKNRSVILDDAVLFATLEPCAPKARKHPKLGCSERIVNARIKHVFVGVEDPYPTVAGKGLKYLKDNGVTIHMFDSDLQEEILKANEKFIKQAEEKAKLPKKEETKVTLSEKENPVLVSNLNDLSKDQIQVFIDKAKLNVKYGSDELNRTLARLKLLTIHEEKYVPTGYGLLLLGDRPQLNFPNSLIRATYKTAGRAEEIQTFEGSLPIQIDQLQVWYERRIGSQIDRTQAERQVHYDYPLNVFREAAVNAIAHRDYDIEGAPIYFEINDDAIIVRSPGHPVEPITLEQMRQLNAPSLSRNPIIIYVLDQLKLVEQRGLGFKTIKQLAIKDIPLPIITFEDPYLTFTFPRNANALRRLMNNPGLLDLNDEEIKGYDWIRLKDKVTRKEYEEKFGFDKKKAERHLSRMVEKELIERKGAGPSTHYEVIAT